MNSILEKLAGGDLRSDGEADNMARRIIEQPDLLPYLMEGFQSNNEIIRMRTAHAVEVVSRQNGDLLETFKAQLIQQAKTDTLPETRWHLAQVFGNLSLSDQETQDVLPILFEFLTTGTTLVRAWAVVGLANIAKSKPFLKAKILKEITTHESDQSQAVRNRVKQALRTLT